MERVSQFHSLIDQDLTRLQVVIKNPADFMGNVLGQSETNTKAILATTVGKVLIIDEVWLHHTSLPSESHWFSGLHAPLRLRQRGEHRLFQNCCHRYSCCRGSERSGRR